MVKVECWMCGESSTELELDEDGLVGFVVPMVNCDGCGCLLDKDWLQSRALKITERCGWEEIELCRKRALRQGTLGGRGTQPVGHRLLGMLMAALVIAHITVVYLGNAFLLIPDVLFELKLSHEWLFRGLVAQHIVALGIYCGLVMLYWNVTRNHPGRIRITETISENTGYSWCHRCEFVKPPDAHHCRRCGTCVNNMDHHCMYTANTCIGQDNVSYFIRFLQILVLGSALSSLAALSYAWMFRARLLHSCSVSWIYANQLSKPGPFHHIYFLYHFAFSWVSNPPTLSDLVWLESFVVSIAACIGSIMILQRQLVLKTAGTTYLKVYSSRYNKDE